MAISRKHLRGLKSTITNPRVMGGATAKARKSPKVRTVPKSAKELEAQNSRRQETEARIQATLSGLTVYYKRRPSEIDAVGECENGGPSQNTGQKQSTCLAPKKKGKKKTRLVHQQQYVAELRQKILKLKRKKRQLKVASAEFDDFAQKHRLEGNDEDLEEGVDYKYLYHASLQKQAEKKILMEPSVRRVSLYNKDFNAMIKKYNKGEDLEILLRPLPKGKAISSGQVSVSTDLLATIVPKGGRSMSFYTFALNVCPMAFNREGARFFTTSGRGNKELRSKKMPSVLVDGFVDVVLKAAAKMKIGLTDLEKIDNSKKKEKKNEEGMKKQHARKALTNWLARIKNKNRSKKVKVDPSASAAVGVDK